MVILMMSNVSPFSFVAHVLEFLNSIAVLNVELTGLIPRDFLQSN